MISIVLYEDFIYNVFFSTLGMISIVLYEDFIYNVFFSTLGMISIVLYEDFIYNDSTDYKEQLKNINYF